VTVHDVTGDALYQRGFADGFLTSRISLRIALERFVGRVPAKVYDELRELTGNNDELCTEPIASTSPASSILPSK
jgi:hypothetical protein